MIYEANEPSSACRLWRICKVETSTPPRVGKNIIHLNAPLVKVPKVVGLKSISKHLPALFCDLLKQPENSLQNFRRSFCFQITRSCPPRFVAAKRMLPWRRQIPVVAISQLDRKRGMQRALLFHLQPDLRKHFTRNRRNS